MNIFISAQSTCWLLRLGKPNVSYMYTHLTLFSRNINIYLKYLLFLHTVIAQAVEILSHGRQGPAHLHNQYHGFWCPGNARSQSISNHDFDYVETKWLGHHTLKVQLFLFAFFIQPTTVTCPLDQFYIVKKLNAYLNINISFSVIHLQPVLAYELMKYQKGVKHGRQQTTWSSPAFSHEISRMHGKLCSSPIKLLWVCHFHPSLNNTWLQTFTY